MNDDATRRATRGYGVAIFGPSDGGFAIPGSCGGWRVGTLDRLVVDHVGLLVARAAALLEKFAVPESCELGIVRADLPDDVPDEHALSFGGVFGARKLVRVPLQVLVTFLGMPPATVDGLEEHLPALGWAAYQRGGLDPCAARGVLGLALGAALFVVHAKTTKMPANEASASEVATLEAIPPGMSPTPSPVSTSGTPSSPSSSSPTRATTRTSSRPAAARWLSINDIVAEFGLTRSAVYRLPIRYFTPAGKRRRYLRADVEAHFRAAVHPVAAVTKPSMVLTTARGDATEDLQAEWDKLADDHGL